MKYLLAVALLALAVAACGKKEEPEGVPPGFCKTEAECQPVADRQNAYQDQLREKLMTQGVHEQYLPCGNYKATKAPNGYWNVTRQTAGCPATASQQDPHPDPSKAKQSKH
jgi:predicted small lipoprotein YifL